MMEPKRGALAVCSLGSIGIITSDTRIEVAYPDGKSGMAWVGLHLTDKVAAIGDQWSSRNPIIIGYLQ